MKENKNIRFKSNLKVNIDGKLHYVVCIEYIDKIPFTVVTMYFVENADTPYWRTDFYDAFACDGDKKDIRLYHSGGGGDICAPNFVKNAGAEIWIAEGIQLKGKIKNAVKLNKPRVLKNYRGNTSINPFNIGEITHNSEYCDRCGHTSTEFCTIHKYDDDEGNERYKDNDQLVNY